MGNKVKKEKKKKRKRLKSHLFKKSKSCVKRYKTQFTALGNQKQQ